MCDVTDIDGDKVTIANLLTEWKLESLIDVFQEQGITSDILEDLLEENNLEQLPTSLGQRILLRKKIQEFINKKTSESTDDLLSISTISGPSSDSNLFRRNIQTENETNNILILTPAAQSSSTIEFPVQPETSFSTVLLPTSEVTEPSPKKQRGDLICEFNLKNYLRSQAIGRGLLNWYDLKGGFDAKRQGYLVEIITTHFLNNDYTHLNHSEYNTIANKIVELFPNELKEAYYCPAIKKRNSRDNKSELPKGKLVDKFKNKCTFLRESKVLPSRSQSDRSLHNEPQQIEENENLAEDNPSLLWLKHNIQPWEDVVRHWDCTFNTRRQKILNENNPLSLEEIFDEFPILNESNGISLISRDFDKLFPNKANILFTNLESSIRKLIQIRKGYVVGASDKLLLDLTESENIESDYLHYLMLVLMPSLLPFKGRHTLPKNKEIWKPKVVDSRDGIILRAELPADIETLKDRKKERMNDLSLPVQPYIIVEGSGVHIRKVYVCVNDKLYLVPTVLKAIDACFHCYHVFNLRYQFQSEHIWSFIQFCMYKLHTKWDTRIPNILDIVNKIDKDNN